VKGGWPWWSGSSASGGIRRSSRRGPGWRGLTDRGAGRRAQGARRAGRRLSRVDRVVGGPAAPTPHGAACQPVLALEDGALGFWGALREVFPATREQRCWFHKIANVLGALPKSAHPGAKKALAEIWNAEDRRHALDAVSAFKATYGAKFGKAVAKITDDFDELLAFYDFPAEHWIHLRTTNPSRHVRHRPAPDEGHPQPRLAGSGVGGGVQADAGRPGSLARGQRPASGCPRPRRRHLRQQQARRTTRRDTSPRSRLRIFIHRS